jgi:hypothetical protein
MRPFAFASSVTLLAALVALATGCGAYKGPDPTAGPNYSTTGSCAENCGNDAQCQASCTDTRNPNIPMPVYTGK